MKVDLSYPRKFICVQSSACPTEKLSFNEHAKYICDYFPEKQPIDRLANINEENQINICVVKKKYEKKLL
jgi:hypothetical protein